MSQTATSISGSGLEAELTPHRSKTILSFRCRPIVVVGVEGAELAGSKPSARVTMTQPHNIAMNIWAAQGAATSSYSGFSIISDKSMNPKLFYFILFFLFRLLSSRHFNGLRRSEAVGISDDFVLLELCLPLSFEAVLGNLPGNPDS